MKEELLRYLKTNCDRFAERYMCKREPELWSSILSATSFLPDTALPKQRCWHVLNDNFAVPLCPVTGEEVKWFENRYLAHASRSAKAQSPVVRAKSKATYEKRTGHVGHWFSNPEVRARIFEKRLTNPQRGFVRSEEWHRKIKQRWDEKLGIERRVSGDFEKYRNEVSRLSNHNHNEARPFIKDHHLKRGHDYHLDHIFSVFDGWRLGVSPAVISHPSNLRMLSTAENSRKQHRSDKTLDALYCDILDFNTEQLNDYIQAVRHLKRLNPEMFYDCKTWNKMRKKLKQLNHRDSADMRLERDMFKRLGIEPCCDIQKFKREVFVLVYEAKQIKQVPDVFSNIMVYDATEDRISGQFVGIMFIDFHETIQMREYLGKPLREVTEADHVPLVDIPIKPSKREQHRRNKRERIIG